MQGAERKIKKGSRKEKDRVVFMYEGRVGKNGSEGFFSSQFFLLQNPNRVKQDTCPFLSETTHNFNSPFDQIHPSSSYPTDDFDNFLNSAVMQPIRRRSVISSDQKGCRLLPLQLVVCSRRHSKFPDRRNRRY